MAIQKKFGVPFSGAADQESGAWEDAAKAAPFPSDQVDESRKGALRGDSKTDKSYGYAAMQSEPPSSDGYVVMKKMESF